MSYFAENGLSISAHRTTSIYKERSDWLVNMMKGCLSSYLASWCVADISRMRFSWFFHLKLNFK